MHFLTSLITAPASLTLAEASLFFMRVGLGILSVGHGYPKIVGGFSQWHSLGLAMSPVGITFLPTLWGFLGACIEFFGGLALIFGLGTRIASPLLVCMMIVAFLFHRAQGDPFSTYSFSLTLVVIFIGFTLLGSGRMSLDYYLYQRQHPEAPHDTTL